MRVMFFALFMYSGALISQSKYFFGGLDILQFDQENSLYRIDNNYVLFGGSSNGGGQWNGNIVLTDLYGTLINYSLYQYNEMESHSLKTILIDNGNFVSAGFVEGTSNGSSAYYRLFSINSPLDNSEFWIYDSVSVSSVFETSLKLANGNLVFGGAKEDYWTSELKPYLLFVSSEYEVLIDKVIQGYTGHSPIEDLAIGPDGNIYALITTNWGSIMQSNIALIKMSPDGETIFWQQEYNLGSTDKARRLLISADGHIYISYYSYITIASNLDGMILKIDLEGNMIWNKQFLDRGQFFNGVETINGNIIYAGYERLTDDIQPRLCITKINTGGDVLWKRVIGGDGLSPDWAEEMIVEPDGSIVCVGRKESGLPPGEADILFVKTNCMGLLTEPLASFTAEEMSDENYYLFANTSQFVYPDSIDGGRYLWDFGDGTISQSIEAIHGYAPGSYYANLTAIVCQDTSRYGICLQVGGSTEPCDTPWIYTSVHEPSLTEQDFNSGLLLYPNPSGDVINIDLSVGKITQLQIANNLGKISTRIMVNHQSALQYDISSLNKGIYFIEVINDHNEIFYSKFIKQ